MTIIHDSTTAPSPHGPRARGWVVETLIEGRLAWMIQPVPLEPYTFTFDATRAHIFEHHLEAKDCRASVWCWHDRWGQHPFLDVAWADDAYWAKVAAD